jgi:hypothetical protein
VLNKEERFFIMQHADDQSVLYSHGAHTVHNWDVMAELMKKHFNKHFDREDVRRFWGNAKEARDLLV